MPGVHNALNAAGATAALHAAGADTADAAAALRDFPGAGRRYELRGSRDGCTVVDDYAHHPTEVRGGDRRRPRPGAGAASLVCFQPHLYSRTSALAYEFGEALGGADEVVVTEIYPARERPGDGRHREAGGGRAHPVPAGDAGGLPAAAGGRRRVPAHAAWGTVMWS